MAVVCVDAGTTMIKAVGYDEEGAEAVVARRATTVTRPRPGWAEQDMNAVWEAVVSCVREVVEGMAGPVDYVAVTAQGDGCWLVGPDGEPTGPAILWNDARAAAFVADWTEAGVLKRAFHRNGSLTFAGLPNAVLAWLRLHDPERLDRSATALTCGGWLFSKLTGRVAVDSSDASAPFTDLATGRYSAELLALYDLEWAAPLLPEQLDDEDRAAPLTAQGLGLPAGTPVVLSSYDIASTAVGVGAVTPGQACTILGTTLCTEIVTDRVELGERASGLTVALGLPGLHLRAFPTLAGGEVIGWACEMLGLSHPADLGELATLAPAGAEGLVFLPYLSPAGERAPFLDPFARGAFVGLSFEHRREHLARAVMEGLSMVIRDCLTASHVRPTELRVCGGGAASEVWTRLIADVTGLPVLRTADEEAGARGAYVMGGLATGALAKVPEPRVRQALDPAAGPYDELFDRFLRVRESVRSGR
ncbi:FGGY-family carbohydrate kinase [Nonomuraea dietziae]|uniref:Xylulokinase n=1 Tax=Nonomuraea dietziae TaxID=65515 RepID=A0A7W5Y5Y6_9ACTN|nr:FGGY-family carbohydrate kinase [Nonomuraea dietziae]MBB3725886.1 xylulokinase [Nonomuraea dietziae]